VLQTDPYWAKKIKEFCFLLQQNFNSMSDFDGLTQSFYDSLVARQPPVAEYVRRVQYSIAESDWPRWDGGDYVRAALTAATMRQDREEREAREQAERQQEHERQAQVHAEQLAFMRQKIRTVSAAKEEAEKKLQIMRTSPKKKMSMKSKKKPKAKSAKAAAAKGAKKSDPKKRVKVKAVDGKTT
jgi:hypothetical protein